MTRPPSQCDIGDELLILLCAQVCTGARPRRPSTRATRATCHPSEPCQTDHRILAPPPRMYVLAIRKMHRCRSGPKHVQQQCFGAHPASGVPSNLVHLQLCPTPYRHTGSPPSCEGHHLMSCPVQLVFMQACAAAPTTTWRSIPCRWRMLNSTFQGSSLYTILFTVPQLLLQPGGLCHQAPRRRRPLDLVCPLQFPSAKHAWVKFQACFGFWSASIVFPMKRDLSNRDGGSMCFIVQFSIPDQQPGSATVRVAPCCRSSLRPGCIIGFSLGTTMNLPQVVSFVSLVHVDSYVIPRASHLTLCFVQLFVERVMSHES